MTAGNHCTTVVAKSTVITVPTTNSGRAARINVAIDDDVSNFLSRLRAAYEPMTIEIGIDPAAARSNRKNDAPMRGAIRSLTGIIVAKDSPRSPVNTPPNQLKYCW